MFDIDWRGLLLPLAYLVVLGGALMTFSTVYRKRKASMLMLGLAARIARQVAVLTVSCV